MRWLIPLMLTGCMFDEPSLSGAHFKCDDDHACPSGQQCVAGVCDGMGSGSNVGFDGIKCGNTSCGMGMQCCSMIVGDSVCQPVGTACAGGGAGTATCDGTEDCPSNKVCCGSTNTICGPPGCSPQVCQTSEDCPNGGACCRELPYEWGICGVC